MVDEEDGWVTHPDAIKTAVALNAIRPGDQVLITVRGTTLGEDQEGVQTVQNARGWSECPADWQWGESASWAEGEPTVLTGAFGHFYTERSIAAWKPAKR